MASFEVSSVKMPVFAEDAAVDSFLERLECYFAMCSIDAADQPKVLVMGLTSSQYEVLRDMVSPDKPNSKSYDELKTALESYYGATRHWMAERRLFRSVQQKDGESVHEFAQRLKNASRHCNFTSTLQDNLVEQFVAGVGSVSIQNNIMRLADEKLKDFKTVLVEASKYEANTLKPKVKTEPEDLVARINSSKPHKAQHKRSARQADPFCYRCGHRGHMANSGDCVALDKTCYVCKKVGHFAGSVFCDKDHPQNLRGINAVGADDDASDDDIF